MGRSNQPSLPSCHSHIDCAVDRYDHREGNDDYSQPSALFQLFDEGQMQRLFVNIAGSMAGVPPFSIDRQLAHFDKVPPDYGHGVRAALETNQ